MADGKSNERIIRIADGRLYFTPDQSIDLNQTNLPPKSIQFRPHREIFWKVALVDYRPDRAAVRMAVLDYHAENLHAFHQQTLKKPVQRVEFTELLWHELEPLLSFYHKIDLEEVIREVKEPEFPGWLHQQEPIALPVSGSPAVAARVWKERMYVEWSQVHLGMGEVRVEVHSKWKVHPVELVLVNTYLVPEFNWIKPFFSKALGTKKISIDLKWQEDAQGIQLLGGHSPEIERIDPRMIEVVRRLHFMNRWNEPVASVDKSLFTSDELQLIETGDEEKPAKPEKTLSEEDLLHTILEEMKVRNAPQLKYLAGKLQEKDQKLRFTLKPYAGFLFYIRGESMHHHCWELLNTHATYLWSFDPAEVSTKEQFRIMEGIIGLIREHGRQRYKSHWKSQSLYPDRPLFRSIEHTHAGSAVKSAFPVWRQKITESIV